MKLPKRVYLIGIGGVGMGALAGLFKKAGAEVYGSEAQKIYPPMSELLKEIGAQVFLGFNPENLVKVSPELVIIGNVARYDNPEVKYVLSEKIPYLSLPEALFAFFIMHRKSLVVAGTHGKTTTSALLAHALRVLGESPTFFLGGMLRDLARNFELGQGKYVVLEGDEYDSAFFDKRPKFIHYAPLGAILTSLEFDHADIYEDFSALESAFGYFVSLIPSYGSLVYFADKNVAKVAQISSAKKLSYGPEGELKLVSREVSQRPIGQWVNYQLDGKVGRFFLPLIGEHNALNALGVLGLLKSLGFSEKTIEKAFASFPGTKRRQEVLLEDPCLVIDDFAHHPTAVSVTIAAVRETWPKKRLIACFEPRTNTSRRKIFQEDYAKALSAADVVFLKNPPNPEKVPKEERLDLIKLVKDIIACGKEAYVAEDGEALFVKLKKKIKPGDVVLFMSNGPFDNLTEKLVAFCRQNLKS